MGGVQTISAAGSSPITLTSPAAFTPTPAAGPTQAQNGVLRFTGVLTSNVQITLPLPGFVIIENNTTGAFVLSFRAISAGEVIGIPQGGLMHVYNDGTNVRFVKGLGEFPGKMDFLGGVSAIPAWMSACTQPPFLIADGLTYSSAAFPGLNALYGATFGGNGITTFGVPDLRGRVPLAYDGTGTRITVAGCGLNGQTVGAAQDKQTNTIVTGNLPPYTPQVNFSGAVIFTNSAKTWDQPAGSSRFDITSAGGISGTGVAQGGTSTPVNNVQPSQVAGIWLVKT